MTIRKFSRPRYILYLLKNILFVLHANPGRLLIYGTIMVLFVFELFVYYGITWSWNVVNCQKTENCTRILLAADPQLIGLHNEPVPLITPISIWDSDRYLAKTFSFAFHFSKPDVVIFLGDIFDEGSTATNSEFKNYYHRFMTIFVKEQYNHASYIWVPGDNDIGGEGNDWITDHKVQRFKDAFQQSDIIKIKNVKFCKINDLTSSMPDNLSNHDANNIIVGLSHIPLLGRFTSFIEKVLHKLKPHLFFTAHTHHSMIFKTTKDHLVERLINYKQTEENKVYQYDLGASNIVHEITVPTCSYRMGTNTIGYGFAVIENKSVSYTVLWSPSRYLQLMFYGMMLIIIFIYIVYLLYKKSNIMVFRKSLQIT